MSINSYRKGLKMICPKCGKEMKKYDKVQRTIRTKSNEKKRITIQRYYCKDCNLYKRDLPDQIVPYKRYEREIIEGVQEGLITADTLGFEDYPSEKQMERWRKCISYND